MRLDIFDFAISRPIFISAVALVSTTLGLFAAFNLPVREFPDVELPSVSITTVYAGAQAGVVEREVTQTIEEALSGVEGIRQIISTTRNETSVIDVQLQAGVDVNVAASDIRDRVATVRGDLPPDVEEPLIGKANSDTDPIIILTLRSDELDAAALTDIADRMIIDAIGALPGVARVVIGGEKRYAMRIRLDRAALAARGLTPSDVANRLQAENVELPAGEIQTDMQLIGLRADARFSTVEDFRSLSLVDRDGARVALGDVADIEIGVENETNGFRMNGREAIALEIIRQSSANTIEVAAAVRAEVDALASRLPASVILEESFSAARYIEENLANVLTTLLVSVGVVIVVLYLFLGSARATIIPALTIPASVIPAALLALAFGYSINVLTILAVILAISLCTDDAVVIMENIRRRQKKGEPILMAASNTTREIGVALFAGTLVLLAVVLPLAIIPGKVGLIFREFAVVLGAIVAFSTVMALFLSPMLSARLFKQDDTQNGLERAVGNGLSRLSSLYGRALAPALNRPVLTFSMGASVIVAACMAYTTLATEVAPDEDRGSLTIYLIGPEGSSSAFLSEQMETVEALVQDVSGPDGPVASILSTLSPGNAGQGDPAVGMVTVVLRDWSEREEDGLAFQARVQEALSPVTAVRLFVLAPNGLAIAGRPIDIAVRGADRQTLAGWADQLVAQSGEIPGVFAMWSDYSDRTPQLSISIDRSRANALGLDARQIGETLQIMFGSSAITRFVDRGVEYDVLVESRDRLVPADIESVFVRAGNGALVPLSAVVTITETSAPSELQRIDRQPAVLVGGGLWGGSLGTALETIVDVADRTLPEQASISFVGQSLDFQESGAGFVLILALILLLSYFVLAAQFESFVDPIVVLIAAPASMAGGVLALYFAGLTVNVYTQIAMLLLIGLVAKNAILLIEFAKQRREEGVPAREAIFEACTIRLRPILMTTVATIIGAIPLMFETGAGGHARFSVGLVIACGTTIGTMLTLFVVPAVYLALSRFTRPRNEVALQIESMRQVALQGATANAGR